MSEGLGDAHPWAQVRQWLSDTLDSAVFARAFTLTALAAVLAMPAIIGMTSLVSFVTIIVGLCLVGLAVLVRRRRELDYVRLLPWTLVAFLAWLLATAFWSYDPARSLAGWAWTVAVAFLAIVIAHVRDTLQTLRALGDVLRVLLAVSLLLEIVSGVLLDLPILFLGIQGNLAVGGPLQGLFGTRNMLGFVAVIAGITFIIEWRIAALRRGVAIASIALAGGLALFSASPTVLVLLVAVGAVTGALALVRHTPPERRPALQIGLASVVTVGLIAAYLLRHTIIGVLNARTDFYTRAELWDRLLIFSRIKPLQGWGWFGPWRADEAPFAGINAMTADNHASALNAYFDVLLQAGWVGLLLFAAICLLALGRSWLVASARRSVLYAWTPLVLVTILVDSMFESFALSGAGWLLLVLCVVRAGLSRSWRQRLENAGPPTGVLDLPPR